MSPPLISSINIDKPSASKGGIGSSIIAISGVPAVQISLPARQEIIISDLRKIK